MNDRSKLPADVSAVFDEIVDRMAPLLGPELRAVYAVGSAVLGGYVPGSSDVDGYVLLQCEGRDLHVPR